MIDNSETDAAKLSKAWLRRDKKSFIGWQICFVETFLTANERFLLSFGVTFVILSPITYPCLAGLDAILVLETLGEI